MLLLVYYFYYYLSMILGAMNIDVSDDVDGFCHYYYYVVILIKNPDSPDLIMIIYSKQ